MNEKPFGFVTRSDPSFRMRFPVEKWIVLNPYHPYAGIFEFTEHITGESLVYSVELAKTLIVRYDFPVIELFVPSAIQTVDPNIERKSAFRVNRPTDLSVPLIAVSRERVSGDGAEIVVTSVLIDGWGRIREAYKTGVEWLPMIVVPPEYHDQTVLARLSTGISL